ncbi:MAG TPA: choice-of-anchor D domain-containing protein [Terracidiphilus sp.]
MHTIPRRRMTGVAAPAQPQVADSSATWEALGPATVATPSFGQVTGRVSSLALDPADSTGNTLYVGTTGGGVWLSTNAATAQATDVKFMPLTDRPSVLATAIDASISIGALTVQPGGTGVVLAGTGDPNDALDSYYGAGLLRSDDSGKTWKLISGTSDQMDGLSTVDHGFRGEGFAGFSWSTLDPQVVVAAVSQSFEGSLVHAGLPNYSYLGLYYSKDAGQHWHLATITDGGGLDVQGPVDAFAGIEGNAATAVVWNRFRKLFIASVRFHGYYQSADGVTWTRLAFQPGSRLTSALCPTNSGSIGSPACPIFRGALAVNPETGDTFAWTVDENNQDQGLWRDACAASGDSCANTTIAFANQVSTSSLQSATTQGVHTVPNGDYDLALAALPSDTDTVLLAGANDLWKCSLRDGCTWRNVTNSTKCMSAHVGEYQHAIEWNTANPLEVMIGNDSGLWRSEDGISETGPACSSSDADHFQNLNGAIGSLAEVETMSQVVASPYTLMAGLGANGTAGVKSTSAPVAQWPQILSGEGGPVAIDGAAPDRWYVNNGAGVSIHLCSSADACTQASFGDVSVVSNADVGSDGLTMTQPAPFLVDPLDHDQLIVATCRLWRGSVGGGGWTSANAITSMLGSGTSGSYCSGNALIRSVAAMALAGGGEVVYAGTFGSQDGGANLGGHLLKATMNSGGTWSDWTELTFSPVLNDSTVFNAYSLDISNITVDPHDTSGKTVYVTITGFANPLPIRTIYRSADAGAHWQNITSNHPYAPANALVVDPVDANTVYVASDVGVYATQTASTCGDDGVKCWFAYGTGLPLSPVITLSASPAAAKPNVLVAGTYGRGIWQVPLLTAGQQMTTATVSPASLAFADQGQGTTSDAKTITLTNTLPIALTPALVTVTGDFAKINNCEGLSIDVDASCTIQVTFSPTRMGSRTGQLTIRGNLSGGDITIGLSGTGVAAPEVNLQPATLDFGDVETGATSEDRQVTAENAGGAEVSISSVTVTGPFVIATNGCAAQLAAHADCQIVVNFKPAETGAASGALTMVDAAGTQTVTLSGTGTAPPGDGLSPESLSFPATIKGVKSTAQTVTLTNSGGNPLTGIAVTVSAPFLQTNNCSTQLVANASCSIDVVYLPTATGAQTGTLTVTDILHTQTVALSGTGLLPPTISVSPVSLTFDAQPVDVTSAPLTLTVSNTGGAAMSDVGFQLSGPSAANFARGTTTCGATLDKSKSCTVQVTFKPTASGTAVATLTVTSSTAQVQPANVPLSGNGQSAAGLRAQPSQLIFGATALGQRSDAQTVTVTNTGQTSAEGLTVTAAGPFSLTQNQCGGTLAGGASCTTKVLFTPRETGILTGALAVASTSVLTPATVALSGTGGLTGGLYAQPAQVSFPTAGVGTTSSAITVTLTNTSPSVALSQFALTTSSSFRIASTTCVASLAANAQCTANVVFTPAVAGSILGTLSITATELPASLVVPLSGTGYDFTSTMSGSPSQTVSSGQTASYTLAVESRVGSGSTFTFQCGALPQYAACAFNPSSLSIAANVPGQVVVQVTTSQNSAELEWPAWRRAVVPVSFGFGLLLVPLAWRRRRGLWLAMLLALCVGAVASCAGAGGGGGSTPPPPTKHNVAPGSYTIPVTITSNGVQHAVNLTLVVD